MRPLALIIFLWLLSCALPARAQTAEAPVFEGGEGMQFFLQCARDYEKLRPGTHINLYGDPRIADKVRVRLLEGKFPELTNANLNYDILIARGEFYAFNQLLDGPSWDGKTRWRDTFLKGSLDRYTVDDKIYGIPLIYTVTAVWYNKALFAQHGWSIPRTWPEFFQLSEKIKKAGLSPLAFQGRYTQYATPLIQNTYYQLAGRERFFAQQRLEAGSFDNPEMVETLRILQKVASECFQPGAQGMSHTEAQLEFFQGHTAMITCGSWLKSEMLGNIPEGFQLAEFSLPLPTVAGDDQKLSPNADPKALLVGAGYYFAFEHSPQAALGADFLRYLTAPEVALRFARERDIPVAVRGANQGLSSELQDIARMVEQAESSFGELPGGVSPAMQQYWSDARFDILNQKSTPAAIAKKLEANAARVRFEREHPNLAQTRHAGKTGGLIAFLLVALAVTFKPGGASKPASSPTRRLSGSARILFLAIPLGLYTLLLTLPAMVSLVASLTQWDGLTTPAWNGIQNFRRLLLESDLFWTALSNNLFIMLVIPAFVLPLSLFFAASLSRRVRGASLFRIAFFFPNLLGVAGILLWQQLYNPVGPINKLLTGMGMAKFEGFSWLAQDHLYWSLVPMSVWAACGFNMILFLAAMESVPEDLYEAAELEGASEWQKFCFVTIPMIWDTLVVALVFLLIGGMKSFETVWLLTNQDPTSSTHLLGTLMVRSMFTDMKMGEATALAVVLLCLVMALSVLTRRLLSRAEDL